MPENWAMCRHDLVGHVSKTHVYRTARPIGGGHVAGAIEVAKVLVRGLAVAARKLVGEGLNGGGAQVVEKIQQVDNNDCRLSDF